MRAMRDNRARASALRHVALPLFVGMLLVQAAWILTLPPFRGTDEIDHSYRAAEVAGGEWVSHHGVAKNGRGLLVRVPRSLVVAARPICTSYRYLGHDNCYPVTGAGPGRVLVATAAGTYNPVYYWVVGTAAEPLAGATALYLERVVTAVICALLVAAAGWATATWSRTRWPVTTLVLTLTPVVLFSASVAAPNGVEICAALALWSCLLALTRPQAGEHVVPLLVIGAVSATALVTLRSIGPLWAALVILTVAGHLGASGVRRLVTGTRRRAWSAVTSVVAVATVASVWWTRSNGVPNFEPTPHGLGNPVTATLAQYPLWVLQGIAAFPRRHDAAPALVYVLVGLVSCAVVVAGFRAADRRTRSTMLVVVLLALLVPFVLTMTTVSSTGVIWQGRYGAPYHLGLVLLAGLSLDQQPSRRRSSAALATAAIAGMAVAHAASVLHVLHGELRDSPLVGSSAWVHVPPGAVVVLVGAGFAAWLVPVALTRQEALLPVEDKVLV